MKTQIVANEAILRNMQHTEEKIHHGQKEVEKQGGYTEAFMQGYIQNEIASSAQMRDENIATRKEVLLGVNQYPNNDESLHPKADSSFFIMPVVDPTDADAQPLIPYRGAEGFEFLRMATEKAGKRPKVFLLTIGDANWRKGRADFAANFFGCVGRAARHQRLFIADALI